MSSFSSNTLSAGLVHNHKLSITKPNLTIWRRRKCHLISLTTFSNKYQQLYIDKSTKRWKIGIGLNRQKEAITWWWMRFHSDGGKGLDSHFIYMLIVCVCAKIAKPPIGSSYWSEAAIISLFCFRARVTNGIEYNLFIVLKRNKGSSNYLP